ncbi:MAG: hypothetical protein PHY15_04825 [Eubacteriales bacterium]|nr:hypothetical protein [Eubacteriales bacterium]MDD4476471.1 hypothetical protein [Eubacteriales bacterium]
MKKQLSILTALILVLSLLSACIIDGVEQSSNMSEESGVESKQEDVKYDFYGLEFKIMTFTNDLCDNGWSHFSYTEDQQEGVVNDAIKLRNTAIEEKYNIKIIEDEVYDAARMGGEAYTTLLNVINSDSDDYYMICPSIYTAAILAQEGQLYDLMSFEALGGLKDKWWDKAFVEEMSLFNKLYFVTGDMAIYARIGIPVMFFNKTQAANYDINDIYELVKNREWTLDKLNMYAKQYTKDLNNDGIIDYSDQYGFGYQVDLSYFWFYCFGGRMTEQNESGEPNINFYNNNNNFIITQILELMDQEYFLSANDYWGRTSEFTFSPSELIRDSFIDGRALFVMSGLKEIDHIATMKDDFGIIPYPLLNEEQEDYSHVLNIWHSNALAIPGYIGDEKAGIAATVMNGMGEETSKTITPAFYETMLKKQKSRDPESSYNLDIILNSIGCDIGHVYNWGNMCFMLNDLAENSSIGFASAWEKIKDKADVEFEQTIEKFRELKK